MDCKRVKYSSHAIQRMFERSIAKSEVMTTIRSGEIIDKYMNDKPYPSFFLLLGMVNTKPIHVVVAVDESADFCYVITVYQPNRKIWSEDYKSKR